jgi:hypothetical protein
MNGVAPPHQLRDAETTTAEALEALRPAGYPAGGWLVQAGAAALEHWYGFQIADLCALFQGAFRGAASALNRGSEMDPFNNLVDRHVAMRRMVWSVDVRPIEKLILLYALQYSDPADYEAPPEGILPFAWVRNVAELADWIGASVPEIKAALSFLHAKGFVEVGRHSATALDLTPNFEAIAAAFMAREG